MLFCPLFTALYSQSTVKEESVVLQTSSGSIYGTLKIPNKETKVPLAIIIAGSGPTDRNGNQPSLNNNSLQLLSNALSKDGIATLCFDKRGIGESQKAGLDESQLRFGDYVNDVRLWIDLITKDDRFSNIIVIGHSEGALIGILASENNNKVSKYISIAGVGESAANVLREQLEAQLIGQSEDMKVQIFSYIDLLEQGKLIENVSPDLYFLFRPSVQPYMISWFKYNPEEEIAKLTIPTLLIQGNMDVQVGVKQVEILSNANSKAQKIVIEGMNHIMKDSPNTDMQEQLQNSYNNPTEPLNKDLVEKIINFIKK